MLAELSGKKKKIRGPRRKWVTIVKMFVLVLFFFLIGGSAGLAAVFYYYNLSLPAIGPLLQGYDPPQTTRILSRDGKIIGELFVERRTVVPIGRIPKVMTNAVIASEDADFRKHEGLDYHGIARAIFRNLTSGRRAQGGSTITQQVARTFFLSREKTYTRKIREVLLTKKIEERLTKDEILYLYLNQINFGHARYGISEAVRYYFGKEVEQITLAEAALLAGIPKSPSHYSPIDHPEAAKQRRAYVLGEMRKLKMISDKAAKRAANAPIQLVSDKRVDNSLAPEAVSAAIDALKEIMNFDQLLRGGYIIETTVDTRLQAAARKAVIEGVTAIDARHGRIAPYRTRKRAPAVSEGPLREGQIYWGEVFDRDPKAGTLSIQVGGRTGEVSLATAKRYNPDGLDADKFAQKGARLRVSLAAKPAPGKPLKLRLEMGPQAALVAIRPEDGTIAAMIGGDRVLRGGFNRATAAKRQPGSAFKPFVYLAAIQSGRYTAATLLDDSPEVQGEWQPQNSHLDEFAGAVRIREALARSLNLPAVKLITEVGPEATVAVAKRLGIASDLEAVPSLALGSSAVSPLELAGAYAVFAGRGKRNPPRILQRILRPDGTEVPLVFEPAEQVISEQEAYIITSLLESVVRAGTGARARQLKRPAAGKTGTSDDQRDAWFAGFTPDYACAVWVGYDDFQTLGRKEYGAEAALPIWIDFMTAAHEGLEKREFEKPEGIVTIKIDPVTGLLAWEGMAESLDEVFIDGTEPTETAVPPELIAPESFFMDQLAGPDAGGPPPETFSTIVH